MNERAKGAVAAVILASGAAAIIALSRGDGLPERAKKRVEIAGQVRELDDAEARDFEERDEEGNVVRTRKVHRINNRHGFEIAILDAETLEEVEIRGRPSLAAQGKPIRVETDAGPEPGGGR